MLLTKHENETFQNQTVYISGQAFIGCTFTACTLVLRETIYHLDRCTFERCNWHVDRVLLWGAPESCSFVRVTKEQIKHAPEYDESLAGVRAEIRTVGLVYGE